MTTQLVLEENEARLLKGVLHSVYKTFSGISGTSQVYGLTHQDLKTIIALHDRLSGEIGDW